VLAETASDPGAKKLEVPAKKAMNKAPASDASQGGNKGKHAGTVSTSMPKKPGKKPEEWTQVKQKVRKPKVRPPRTDAIVIAISTGGSYANILKKVKAEPQLKELGQAVQAVRRTSKGELLNLLNKDSEPKTAELQPIIEAVLGSNVDVKALTETMLIEVKDIDEIIGGLVGSITVRCGTARIRGGKSKGGIRRHPNRHSKSHARHRETTHGEGQDKAGIDLVSITPKRCFKCMEFNHIAGNCRIQEVCSKCCYNCGAKKHQARGCKAKACCMLCKRRREKGHPTMSWKCPYFRRAM